MSSLIRIVSLIAGTFLSAAFAVGAEVQINPNDYNIYIGDLDEDGDNDFYFSQKPLFIILHGDIATPLLVPRNKNYAVYNNDGIYSSASSFSISDDLISSRLTSGFFLFAAWNSDIFIGSNGGSVLIPNPISAPTTVTSFTYDDLGRLKTVTGLSTTSYEYDNADNRTKKTVTK